MKRLTLIRHAKSSWDHPELSDIDRPLNQRGKKNAPKMGQWLAESDFAPDQVSSSPAVRAWTTACILCERLDYPQENIVKESKLYTFEAQNLLKVLRDTDNGIEHLALVGHNPAMTELANDLGSIFIDNIPTCGVVTIDFSARTWKEIGTITGDTVRFDSPKGIRTRKTTD